MRAGRLYHPLYVRVEMVVELLGAEFVHFEADALGCGGVVGFGGGRVAEAHNFPFAVGDVPRKASVGAELVFENLHVLRLYDCARGNLQIGVRREVAVVVAVYRGLGVE